MTAIDATTAMPKPSFGVGSRIGETFSIFFSRFGVFAVIGIAVGLLMQLPNFLILGPTAFDPTAPDPNAQLVAQNPVLFMVAAVLVPLLLYSIMTGMLVAAAYDAKAGRSAGVGSYVGAALKNLLPLIGTAIVAWLLIGVGFALLVIPGIWLLGVFSVIVPAIMVEGAGFGALKRSAQLTKEYRWPIIGFMIVIYLIFYAASFAIGILGALVAADMPMVFLVLQGVAGGITAAIASIAVAVAYARLREIKDGVGFADLADVFA